MKQFPRIHSLATLGIRQHQNFDYQLHSFRTDFIGDSGSGKSMIADLLQLVFIGSDHFHSPTEGLEKREPEGMILKTPGKGTDMGYILVNIEIQVNQYLVIGAYLETITKNSKSFLLQGSYQEDELVPLNNPISCLYLLVNDEIPTLDLLKSHLEESGQIFHSFANRKKFHAYLFKFNVLHIDLSNTPVLKDYATIIQSFSRGKSLDVGDSDSLKNFLFGQEKAKDIIEKYNKAVEELKVSLKEFSVNKQELDIATLKYNAIQNLRELNEDLQSKRADWFVKQCAYLEQETADALRSLQESCKQHIESLLSLRALQEIIRQELAREPAQNLKFEEKVRSAKKAYDRALVKYEKVKPVHDLLQRLGCDRRELAYRYQKYHQERIRKELIERVTASLNKQHLYPIALSLTASTELETVLSQLDTQITRLNTKFEQKSAFSAFVSGTDQYSLGYWFTQNYSPQSRILESIIMFYKSMPVETPVANMDIFINSPERFLQDAVISSEDETGFWLSNGEVRQFVKWIENPLFTSQDAQGFQALLLQVGADLDQEIAELKGQLEAQRKLKSFVIATPDFIPFLNYLGAAEQAQLLAFVEEPDFDIDAADLEQGIALIDHFEDINTAYSDALHNWDICKDDASNYTYFLRDIRKTNSTIGSRTAGPSTIKLLDAISQLFPKLELTEEEVNRQAVYYGSPYLKATDKGKWISETADKILQGFKYTDLNTEIGAYQVLLIKRDDIFKEARLELACEPNITKYTLQLLAEPRSEQQSYEVAKALYQSKFSEIAKIYAPGDAYKFQNTTNFIELTVAVLPDAFLTEEAKEEDFIVQIEKYFSQINEKNKTLNSRKLHRIKEILDDVDDEVERRLDMVRKIHLVLNDEDQEITGGHRVSLRAEDNTGYPRKWIQDYIDKLEQEDTLFTSGQTLEELLRDGTSLQEKMIAAFYHFGGHKSVKATLEKLLNPNSYFKLSFGMESQATGKTNSGSAGQTYAAIALLCIARLSLVSKAGFSKDLQPGIRFMPIDEAEGLGSNFDMLHDIARKFDYQIVTMSIGPLGRFKQGEQYIYILSNNKSAGNDVNHHPLGIFSDQDRDHSPLADI